MTPITSGLVKCKTCRRALTGQYAKSGQFPYYVCQTLMKRGSGSCDTPRLNARRFEKLVVDKIRSNILTEDNIRDLVKTVDEKMDGVAADQHKRLEAIDAELEDVKRHLGRIWHFIGETDNVEMADAADHIRELRNRQERLEDEASAARAILTQRRSVLDDVNTIEAYAKDMRDFLKQSELTERKAFIQSFVKEIVVMPGDALLRYTVPMPSDSVIPGKAIEKMALNGPVLVSVHRSPPRVLVRMPHIQTRTDLHCRPLHRMRCQENLWNYAFPDKAPPLILLGGTTPEESGDQSRQPRTDPAFTGPAESSKMDGHPNSVRSTSNRGING